MRLTVIITNTVHAANVGGPLTYRRVTFDLTPEQAKALARDEKWEEYGPFILESGPPRSDDGSGKGGGR